MLDTAITIVENTLRTPDTSWPSILDKLHVIFMNANNVIRL